jgi:hypothetical protein
VLVDHPEKGLFWLCVEVDEYQHKSYAAEYEESRYQDLFMDFSGRYVFLRINPDSFTKDGVRCSPSFEERREVVLADVKRVVTDGPQTKDLVAVHQPLLLRLVVSYPYHVNQRVKPTVI